MLRRILAAGLLVCLLTLSACGGRAGEIGRDLGLDLSGGSLSCSDDHGGFHGDGLLLAELAFSREDGAAVEKQILSRGDLWNPGPFDDYLGGLLYDNGGPAGEGAWPREPGRGYWYFRDRQENQETPIGQRYSFNYTAALYDADTYTLYYLKFDT